MRHWGRWTGLAVLVVALGIQMVPVERTNPPVRSEIDAPPDVSSILRAACYNCHSHETDWPWYAHVAPASWFVTDHVYDGREDLNFSEWPSDYEKATDLISEIGEQVESGAMPPDSYQLMHPDARLSDEQRQTLIDWSLSEGSLDRLEKELGPGGLP